MESPGSCVYDRAIFAWPCVLSDRPPTLWWIRIDQMPLDDADEVQKIEAKVLVYGLRGVCWLIVWALADLT